MKKSLMLALLVFTLLASACAPAPTAEPTPAELTPIRLPVGYIPNVQFSAFYLGVAQGIFAKHGLDVTLRHHGQQEDVFGAVLAREEHVVFASADEAMVAAAKRNNTVFQCGTIQRSGDHFKEAIEIVKSGTLGQIGHVHTFSIDMLAPTGIGNPPDVTDPEKWKSYGPWETYQGWVEHKPFNVNRWLYNFRWFYDYAGGKLTDWGVHLVDIVLSAMGEDKPPKTVSASGGKFIITDNRTTPDTINVSWEFDSYLLTFTNRVWNSYGDQIAPADNHGIIFYGTKGSLKLSRAGYKLIPGANQQYVPEPGEYESAEAKENTSASVLYEPHLENFINCIRSGEKPISHVESCHNSSTVCHIGNAAYLAGAKLTWDAAAEQFTGGPTEAVQKANEWIARPYQNGYTLG